MNSRPDFTDPWEAARVSSFMADATVGRWKLLHFKVDELYSRRMYAQAIAEGGPNIEARLARTIPPGSYVSLQRRGTKEEIEDIESGRIVDSATPDGDPLYVPVMSDTPAEVREHADAINCAYGDVVITGLGIGCIVSALLAKPEVDTITVVEIDRDVIGITGPYYADEPRVKIVNMDAIKAGLEFARLGVEFDYAWHDIWSHISDRNLDDDSLAEHGISYETMFETYSHVVGEQDAWAYREAMMLRNEKDAAREAMHIWAAEFSDPDTTYDRRVDMLVYFHAVQMFPQYTIGDEIPEPFMQVIVEQVGVRAAVTEQLRRRGHEVMAEEIGRILVKQQEEGDEHDPMQRPNEAPEANVA